jgi:two-component system C4-dicarboxylate transport response regulator DctD
MGSVRSVLVVDDDMAMRDMVVSLLREAGFDVVVAMGADDALAMLRGHYIGVVLSDIRMPGKSGFDFLREVRGVAPSVPVILMTSFGTVTTADRAKREGAFDCLSKPFSREELLETLARALPGQKESASDRSGVWRT